MSNSLPTVIFPISIHGLRVEPDVESHLSQILEEISIHGLRVEPDMLVNACFFGLSHFNPQAPCGARLFVNRNDFSISIFQSTGSVWSPTCRTRCLRLFFQFQSTGSVWSPTSNRTCRRFWRKFQSTGSVWSPTTVLLPFLSLLVHFNPRAPCGARHGPDKRQTMEEHFNPRAPCGARRFFSSMCVTPFKFQSTGSVWSPTRAGADIRCRLRHFNPRAPCGARHVISGRSSLLTTFQSTGSVWSPTQCAGSSSIANPFQSTGSVWSPTPDLESRRISADISIHGLRVEPDAKA